MNHAAEPLAVRRRGVVGAGGITATTSRCAGSAAFPRRLVRNPVHCSRHCKEVPIFSFVSRQIAASVLRPARPRRQLAIARTAG